MASFAQIENGFVINIIEVSDDDVYIDGQLNEQTGIGICEQVTPGDYLWRFTSTNTDTPVRKHCARIGYGYDVEHDVFISIRPFPSWTLNETFDWIPPVSRPNDEQQYVWDETTLNWVVVEST